MFKNFCIPLLLLLFYLPSTKGEKTYHRTLQWEGVHTMNVYSNQKLRALSFKNGQYLHQQYYNWPIYFEKFKLTQQAPPSVQLINKQFQPIEQSAVLQHRNQISDTIQVDVQLTIQRKKPYAAITIVPIRYNKKRQQFERLVSFGVALEEGTSSPTTLSRTGSDYRKNSVLQNGKWYKIAVTENGLHKITYDLLSNIGLNPDNFNPRNLRLYGGKGGRLPEQNNKPHMDDLKEIPIKVKGQGDGSFDQGDYVLFFAKGPHQWQWDSINQRFRFERNFYAKKNYYYLTTNFGAGQRIQTQPSANTSNRTTSRFDDFAIHEQERENFLNTGRQWYGEYFSNQLTYTFDFEFPNIVNGAPVFIKSRVAARSTVGSSTFDVTANNNPLYTHGTPSISTRYPHNFAHTSVQNTTFSSSSDNISVQFKYNPPDAAAEGWLDYIFFNVRRHLTLDGNQLIFRDQESVGAGNVTQFKISNAGSNVTVWEVTNPLNIKKQSVNHSNNKVTFKRSTEQLRTFVAFQGNNFPVPEAIGKVNNQNLHGMTAPDMVILTPGVFTDQAQRLARFHRKESNLSVKVVTNQQVYNEFSSGRPDVAAPRNFMKMFYDRAGANPEKVPDYLLLFGDGSYDYKNIENSEEENTNYILTYQKGPGVNPVLSYVTDDFYGFLDDNEGDSLFSSVHSIDIGIGRLPVSTKAQAKTVVDKIKHYASNKTLGRWRNNITFVADDEDGNLHINQANTLANIIQNNHPTYNPHKIYLDAFEQQSTAGGERYPKAREAINERMFHGTLMINYTGHGGEAGWAHERILGKTDINRWENEDQLALFVTATCEFSRYDDPEQRSAGELTLIKENGGSIGLMTTVRLVYASENQAMAKSFYKSVFPEEGEKPPRLGDIVREAKNRTSTGLGNRKFTLLGDPALRLNYPEKEVVTTKINETPVIHGTDTLKALSKVTIQGLVQNHSGKRLSDFNGTVYPTVFDKLQTIQTLANDPGSNERTFDVRNVILFRGRATIKQGAFDFQFIVPKDINYKFGKGKISYYAENGKTDAAGANKEVIIGGTNNNPREDNQGPEIDIYMNDKNFAQGGLTDKNPLLLLDLYDKSGINTSSQGIGHGITATLDENSDNSILLNKFYEADKDSFQSGEVRYPFTDLEEGRHTLTVEAWDVFNNPSESYTEFIVASSAELALDHVLNYPNPFTTHTEFQFEHNRPGQLLNIRIQIYTINGRLIKTLHRQMTPTGYRVSGIPWNGRDDFGQKIGRGVYVYRLTVSTPDGSTTSEYQKLVILQ